MGQYANISAAIASTISGVSNVGIVLADDPLPPLVEDWETFLATFTTTISGVLQVRAWTVGFVRASATEGRRPWGSPKLMRRVTFVIRGHLGRSHPSSAATFRDLIEGVTNALDADRGLGGTAIDHDDTSVEEPGNGLPILLGDVECHYCEITLTALVEVNLTA
jgi:hypothetical protein